MKQLKKVFVLALATILIALPLTNSLLAVTESVYAAESETSSSTETSENEEVLADKTNLPSEKWEAAMEESAVSEEVPPVIEESHSSTEDEDLAEKAEQEEGQEAKKEEQALLHSLRDANESFISGIQSEENGELTPVYLRDEQDSDQVSVNWKVLKNDGYLLGLQLSDASSGIGSEVISRQMEVVVPRGILVKKDHLQKIVDDNANIYSYSVKDIESTATYQLGLNFKQASFVDPVSGSNSYSTDYVTGATIVFEVSPTVGTLGFRINLLPNYEDGTTNSPNFWTGISGDSLVRHQPLKVSLIENATPVKTLVMDDFIIPSEVSHVATVRSPDSGSVNLGPQTLDNELQMIIQPRVRNTTENSSNNAYYVGNVSYQVYVPYKTLTSNTYLSAELLTDKMDDWINSITQANNGQPMVTYSVDELADGRKIVTYSLANPDQEYLINVVDLSLYYRLPSEEDENGRSFAEGDQLLYTQNNLGWIFHNYRYDEDGNPVMEENTRIPLTNSTGRATITSNSAFNFAFINRSANYSTISVKDTEAVTLLGNALIKNDSTALGTARATYKFDTGTTWNYGVTTVQFWTVFATTATLAESREYTYNFDFVLQKKGAAAGEDLVTGTYALTPSQQYKDVQISRSDGRKVSLLGYDRPRERYYYYVNRQMLSGGNFTETLPADFDINDYYIKELSYDLEITSSAYISGDSGRPKEGGGQFFGHTFGNTNSKGVADFEIKPAPGYSGNTLNGSCTTTIIDKTSNTADVGLLLDDSGTMMTIKNENGQTLSTINDAVDVGKKVTVNANAIACFYPYGATNYAPNPVFLIRTPLDMDLDVSSINLTQNSRQLSYIVDDPILLDDESKLYYVRPTNSDGLGYYNEDRELIGEAITINYQMAVNIRARSEAIYYNELLFVTDQKFAAYLSGSYANSFVEDKWGIASKLGAGKAGFYTQKGITKLATTKRGYVFNTNPAKLDFGYDLELSSNVTNDPNASKDKGVLDENATVFNSKFFFKNIRQNGEVDNNGRFVFYLPVAKKDLVPEWGNAQQSNPEYSLSLKGPVSIQSTKGVTYTIRYSTDQDKRFHNGNAGFTGNATYADYKEYDLVKDSLESVTMIKVVAEPNEETGAIIPFEEEMTAEMPLAYSSDNTADFSTLAGQQAYWTPYVSLIYSMNGSRNEFNDLAPENSLRIRYRPAAKTIDIWAYNSEDYPNGESEGWNKSANVALPSFINQFNLQINQLTSSSLKNMTLVSATDIIANEDKPVSYGNTTFGFGTGLNITDDSAFKDLSDALTTTLAVGATDNSNSLNYKIYNTKNINDTLGERQVVLTYSSAGSDDILFDIILNIKRKISIIDVQPALTAGKAYREFTNTGNSVTTLEDGAFTLQVAYEVSSIDQLPDIATEDDIYLKFGTTTPSGSPVNGLPVGDTILMKVQSTGKDNKKVRPEYYYYKNTTAAPQTKIKLTEFVKMGTETTAPESLTLEAISQHVKAADKLSYLFVFDFANQDALQTSTDTIGMYIDFNEGADTGRQQFIIEPKRSITNTVSDLSAAVYQPHEPIQVNGEFSLSDIGEAIDSYNQDKSLALNLELYEVNGSMETKVNWPQGVLIQNTQDTNNPGSFIRPKNVDGNLQFVYSAGAITNTLQDLSYQLTIYTDVQALAVGKNYKIKVSARKSYVPTHPLNGEEVLNSKDLSFRIDPPAQSGLRVSTTDSALLYNQTNNQKVKIAFSATNIEKVVPVLQKKVGTNYYPETAWSDLIATTLPSAIDPTTNNPFTINFKNQLDDSCNGEYRIVFEAYEKASDTEPLYETAWTFIIWDPPA